MYIYIYINSTVYTYVCRGAKYLPVVLHKAVAEVSKIGIPRGEFGSCKITDGRANPLMD